MATPFYLELWPSGDYSAFPEPKPRCPDPKKFQRDYLSPLGLSHPANSHNTPPGILNNGEKADNEAGFSNSLLRTGDRPEPGNLPDKPPQQRSPRGSGGLTQFAKKMTRSCCQLLEEIAASRPVGFLTLTLPSMTRNQLDLATKRWSDIMHQFNQQLVRRLRALGLPDEIVWVTEWQRHRKALHAHIAFIAANSRGKIAGYQYPIQKEWYRNTWQRILLNILGVRFECKSATRIERVKYSVGAYMSKYISKGDKPIKPVRNVSKSEHAHSFTDIIDQHGLSGKSNAHTVTENAHSSSGNAHTTLGDAHNPQAAVVTEYAHSSSGDAHSSDMQDNTVQYSTVHTVHPPSVSHPSAWWGASDKLKVAVKKRVERWKVKPSGNVVFRRCPSSDEWLEKAERFANSVDNYWSRIVYSAGGIPRAMAGRLRLKSGWKESAIKALLELNNLTKLFKVSEKYWKWRWQRDGCKPEFDEVADLEWIALQRGASVTFGI